MDDEVGLTPRQKVFQEQNPEGETTTSPAELKGVGGWLGFLVVILLFLSPILSALMTLAQQQEGAQLYPELVGGELWRSAMIMDWSMVALSAMLSILAGLLLLKRFRRSSVFIANCSDLAERRWSGHSVPRLR